MLQSHQVTIDDLLYNEFTKEQPNRIAFIDECGNFGFDFDKSGVSKHYIICAIIVENEKLEQLHEDIINIKKTNGYGKTELKSSKIADDDNRRRRIISQLLTCDFKIILFIADKQKFKENSPLREYKTSFIKFLRKQLYDVLYSVYPKLKIFEDEMGTSDFQKSFKKYVIEHRSQYNMFNEYDFDYSDSKDDILVQLADIVAGSINRTLMDPTSTNYFEMLKSKILVTKEFPNTHDPYWGKVTPEECKFNSDIYSLSMKCAMDYIEINKNSENEEKRLQIAFLKYLITNVQNSDPTKFIYADQIVDVLSEYRGKRVKKDYLYTRIVAQLRDEGVIIASSPRGYKIPISVEDIKTYLNSTFSTVTPMIHRVGICRNLIKQKTGNNLDILDDNAYLRYKLYFD